MKKKFMLILLVLLISMVAACSASSSNDGSNIDASVNEGNSQNNENTAETSADSSFPEKDVRLIIPFSPGGGTDIIFRLVIQEAEKHLGQTIVPVNMDGNSGAVGNRYVKDEDPDGYTILGTHDGIGTMYVSGATDFSFGDFEPIALLTKTINMPVVRTDSGITNIQELVDYVKANSGDVRFSIAPGSTSHFFMAQLIKETDIEMDEVNLVGYNDSSEEIEALLAGDVDLIMLNIPAGASFFEEGSLLPLGVANDERLDALPDVPTMHEQGVNMEHASNRGVYAPKGTPKEVIETLEEAFRKALESEELQSRIENELGSITQFLPHDEYKTFLDEQEALFEELAEGLDFK